MGEEGLGQELVFPGKLVGCCEMCFLIADFLSCFYGVPLLIGQLTIVHGCFSPQLSYENT